MEIKKLFYIFKPIIPFLLNSLRLRLVKLGYRMTRSWEKGAQKLHVFSHNWDHVFNSQMGIKLCLNVTGSREPTYISQMDIKKLFYIFKPIIPLLPNSLRSRLVKLGPRMTRLIPQSGPRVQLSNGYPNMISYLKMKNLSFKKNQP